MKMNIIKTTLLSFMLIAGVSLFAQKAEYNPEKRIDNKVERMKAKLDLNETQTAEIKKILLDEEKESKVLREKQKKIREETKAKVENVLTADQKAKYAELKKADHSARKKGDFKKGEFKKGDFKKGEHKKGDFKKRKDNERVKEHKELKKIRE